MSTFIATTTRRGLIASEVAGVAVYKMRPQLCGAIEMGGMSEEYTTLFADPTEDFYGGNIDWYTEEFGDVLAVSSLPQMEQLPYIRQLKSMCGQLHIIAESLRTPGINGRLDQQQRIYAEVIEQSLCAPDGSLYLIDNKLVLVNWGFRSGSRDLVEQGTITKTFPDTGKPRS